MFLQHFVYKVPPRTKNKSMIPLKPAALNARLTNTNVTCDTSNNSEIIVSIPESSGTSSQLNKTQRTDINDNIVMIENVNVNFNEGNRLLAELEELA